MTLPTTISLNSPYPDPSLVPIDASSSLVAQPIAAATQALACTFSSRSHDNHASSPNVAVQIKAVGDQSKDRVDFLENLWGSLIRSKEKNGKEETIKKYFFKLATPQIKDKEATLLFKKLRALSGKSDLDELVPRCAFFFTKETNLTERIALLENFQNLFFERLDFVRDQWPINELSDREEEALKRAAVVAFRNKYSARRIAHWFKPDSELLVSLRTPSSCENPLFRDLPMDLRWRLGIDRDSQVKGPYVFDQDASKGFFQGMEKGWAFLDRIRSVRMDAYLLMMLHDILVEGVSTQFSSQIGYGYSADWGYEYHAEDITDPDQLYAEWESEKLILTRKREKEIYKKIKKLYPEANNATKMGIYQKKYRKYLSYIDIDEIGQPYIRSLYAKGDEKKIDVIFNRFYKEASQAKTLRERYMAVARCCRALLVFHAFPDGNGRTISFSLCELLLNQIGSPYAILDSPTLFEGTKTIAQMVEQIEIGVQRYERVKLAVLIGEFAGVTPIMTDAPSYPALHEFYNSFQERLRLSI